MLKIHIKQSINCKNTGLKRFNGSKAFFEYSNDMDDMICIKKIKECNPNKKQNIDCIWWHEYWYA